MENTRNLITPHAVEIIDAIKYALRAFYENPLCEKLDKTTRANVVHDLAVDRLSNSTVFFLRKRGRASYFLLDEIVFHIKLGDKNGFSKSIMTKAVLDFLNPQTQFAELPNLKKCEVIYILNDTETEISDIRIVFRNNKKIVGYFSILENNSIAQNDIEFLNEELNSNSSSIVKIKQGIIPSHKKEIRDKNE
jgi:hypothetical protein